MRITNNIIRRESLSHMQSSLRDIAKAQSQASSGLRIQKASDDPAGTSTAMRTRGSLRALEQYQRNISMATSRATAEEGVLDQINAIVERARELGVSQGGDTSNTATRTAAAAEARELLKAAVQLGNSTFGDEYLFGGHFSAQRPFDDAATDFLRDATQPPVGVLETEISAGRRLPANHDGQQVFLDSGVFQAIRDLVDGLEDTSDPKAAIGSSLNALHGAFDKVQELYGEMGARTSQLDVTAANLDALDVTLQTLKADIEEVDFEEAITELVARQSTFQAAMLATSKVMGLSLADYLR